MNEEEQDPTTDTTQAPPMSSIYERARSRLGSLSEAEGRVARALIDQYPLAGLETVAKFAHRAGTSSPTILRFIAQLGFSAYSDFQDALRSEIQARLQGPLNRYSRPASGNEGGDIYHRIAQAQARNIADAEGSLDRAEMTQIVDRLCDPQRQIFCLGGRFSWLVAAYMQSYLRELRAGVRQIRDNNAAWPDYLLDTRPGDILLVLDFRRYQADVLEFARGARAQGVEIILITDIWHSPVSGLATFVISCPVGMPSAFDSGVSGLAVAEMIVAGVVDRLGGTAKDRIVQLEKARKTFRLGS